MLCDTCSRHLGITFIGLVVLPATVACADVLNMGGTRNPDGSWIGPASLETVRVGNPGNVGEISGEAAAAYGEDRVSGRVDYAYRIGKYEVTAAQYCEFLNAVAGVDTYGLYNTGMWTSDYSRIERYAGMGTVDNPYQYRVLNGLKNHPVNHVSWGDAARFANWLHNGQPTGAQDLTTTEDGAYFLNGATSRDSLLAVSREADWKWAITSEDEWYKAAYHKNDGVTGNYFDYPMSSSSTPSNDWVHPDSGNNANFYQRGYTRGVPHYLTDVGEFESSDSSYGTYDQGGNVWEWNESILYGSFRGVRGGSFYEDVEHLHASYRYFSFDPTIEFGLVGFRVSHVPEPGSIAFLVLGVRGILGRRRYTTQTDSMALPPDQISNPTKG